MVIRSYDASNGKDFLISFEERKDGNNRKSDYTVYPENASDEARLFSLLRLRIPSQYFSKERHFLPVLEKSALIREIHTYGEQLGL